MKPHVDMEAKTDITLFTIGPDIMHKSWKGGPWTELIFKAPLLDMGNVGLEDQLYAFNILAVPS